MQTLKSVAMQVDIHFAFVYDNIMVTSVCLQFLWRKVVFCHLDVENADGIKVWEQKFPNAP